MSSFDKGFYFNMPVQIFFKKYQTDQTSFSFRPITRDGAARLGHDYTLWSVTSSAERWKLSKDMDTITFLLANISLYLMAMLCISSIVGDSLVELKQLVSDDILIPTISRQLWENYLFVISLCSILMSIILTVIGYVWSFLDPRNTTTTTETKKKKTWQMYWITIALNVLKYKLKKSFHQII